MRCSLTGCAGGSQRGVASLSAVALLLIGLSLALLHVHRGLITDITAAANEERAVRAFEAAEAGLAWATSQMNSPLPVDQRCEPEAIYPGSPSLRQTFLERIGLGAGRAPTAASGPASGPWPASSAPARPQATSSTGSTDHSRPGTTASATPRDGFITAAASCIRRAGIWHCACPHTPGLSSAMPLVAADEGDSAFAVMLSIDSTRTVFEVVSQGCSGGEAPCAWVQPDHATARVRRMYQRLALFRPEDVLHTGLPGARPFESIVGMTAAAFSQLPAVATIRCEADCAPALTRLALRGFRLIRVEGPAEIRSQLTLGTPAMPVMLAVSGTLVVGAPMQLVGLLHATELVAGEASHGSVVRGALLSASNLPDILLESLTQDAPILTDLAWHTGPILPWPGSWDDR